MLNEKSINKQNSKRIEIHELETVIEPIIIHYLKLDMVKEKDSLKKFINLLEKKLIHTALDVTNGNQTNASEILGVGKTTLNEKIKRHKVCLKDYKFDISKIAFTKLKLMK